MTFKISGAARRNAEMAVCDWAVSPYFNGLRGDPEQIAFRNAEIDFRLNVCLLAMKRYGTRVTSGSSRLVILQEKYVYKVPLNETGDKQNTSEADWDSCNIPLAKCEIIDYIHGVSILKMERVTPAEKVHTLDELYKILPGWADFVDCYQVGYTESGELVAYDP